MWATPDPRFLSLHLSKQWKVLLSDLLVVPFLTVAIHEQHLSDYCDTQENSCCDDYNAKSAVKSSIFLKNDIIAEV